MVPFFFRGLLGSDLDGSLLVDASLLGVSIASLFLSLCFIFGFGMRLLHLAVRP